MYNEKSDYKEMQAAAKVAGINLKGMTKVKLAEALNAIAKPIGQRGRKINPTSARQIRLSQVNVGQRGRPADPNSAWNKRQKELAAKREAGELKLGRAINPESARQKRLALKGTLPLGRPKQVKEEVAAVVETPVVEATATVKE